MAVHHARIDLPNVAATEELGRRIGANLLRGQTVGLIGELGAGKTSLTRGLARGVAVDEPDAVASPTYLLVIEHPGPTPLVHIDAYLPAKTRAFLEDGGVDYLIELDAVTVVEWADRIADLLPEDTLWVRLLPAHDGRVAELDGAGAAFAWVADLAGSS